MALRKIYFGTVGPFYYDDADPVNDPDGMFPGENFHGIVTDGQLKVQTVPVDGDHVVRLDDLPYGNIDVNVSDVTGARVLGAVYQNATAAAMIVQIAIRLRL